jgi:hypothetical protein
MDRDELPEAMTAEGGAGANVEHVESGLNRGIGSYVGNKLRKYDNGTKFKYKWVDSLDDDGVE